MFIIVLGQHVSILIESSSDSSVVGGHYANSHRKNSRCIVVQELTAP